MSVPSTACVLIDQSLVSYITKEPERELKNSTCDSIGKSLQFRCAEADTSWRAFSERIHNLLFLHDLQGRGSGWR